MQALSAVGMEQFANHYPKQLSVGMKQRINLARGMCLGTDILLLDEPFAALDEQTRMVLGEDLSILLARTGKTIVFVTHSLAEAVFLADRIVIMTARPGKVKAEIAVPEPHPRSPDFMLTSEFGAIRNDLYALLRDEIRATVARMREARDAKE
jgi:NitT/TauT family transport system ATP-binding protein